MRKPLVIELFAGKCGWGKGFVAEGWRHVGFDIVHEEWHKPVPDGCSLVLQDVLTLHGSQFRHADAIVASPPCQEYSYRAMPWKRAKALPPPSNALFDACFRIQREANEAVRNHCTRCGFHLLSHHRWCGCECDRFTDGERYIPMVVENVVGAQKWVGRAKWHYGSYYLWGDVPAVMPFARAPKNAGTAGGTWFNVSHGKIIPGNQAGAPQRGDGLKTVAHVNKRDGHSHTRHLTNQRESDAVKARGDWFGSGENCSPMRMREEDYQEWCRQTGRDAVKQPGLSGPAWFDKGASSKASGSHARKAASAAIAEIPLELSSYIARVFKP